MKLQHFVLVAALVTGCNVNISNASIGSNNASNNKLNTAKPGNPASSPSSEAVSPQPKVTPSPAPAVPAKVAVSGMLQVEDTKLGSPDEFSAWLFGPTGPWGATTAKSVVVDAAGKYVFEDVALGEYYVQFNKTGVTPGGQVGAGGSYKYFNYDTGAYSITPSTGILNTNGGDSPNNVVGAYTFKVEASLNLSTIKITGLSKRDEQVAGAK